MVTQDQVSGVSFGVDEETRLVLDSLDEFVAREVDPIESELGETWSNPRLRHRPDGRYVEEVVDAIDRIRRRSADAGFYAMNLPEEVGGEGVSTVTWYRAKRHVASHGTGLTEFVLAGPEGPKPLLADAEGDQVDRYLEPAIAGEKSTAFALTEPGVGSDAPDMDTSAERDGDEWVLNGRKQWITNAPYADFVQVFARTMPQSEAGRYGGITCFLVEADEYELGAINNAVGMEGMQAELVFDDVRLPADRVLGEVDAAFYTAMEFLSLGRLELAAEAVGFAEHLLDRGVEYANQREAFGRSIGSFQGISHKLARGRARSYAADAAGLRAAWDLERTGSAIEAASIAKWFATNVCWDVADDVVQVHGSSGLAEENPYVDHLLMARILRIVEGTDEIQLNTIADQLGVN
ncbi:acyl-CoA dehydrogenase family protein [Halosolutus amylolyticus]|uniref:Acyl-CoA dehydrogenase family protein n=1 Tax=Halosolutus amylolyticus TaxID=2932267 RepID=A0ABD5PM88_9EURY|nr:acyl-CoA dehydrogenase family protein [Halosolutus amylolyticus]